MGRKTHAYLAVLSIALLLSFAIGVQANGNGKSRVIAHTDKEVSDALAKGCKVVREARTLKALTCPEDL